MMLLRTLAPWLLLACLAQQVSVSTGARDGKGRKGKGGGGGKPEQPPPPPTPVVPDSRAERRMRPAAKGATKGRFTTKDKLQCTWAARGEDTVTLAVECKNPVGAESTGGAPSDFTCAYRARPDTCPGFETNPAGYWKQVARALKKLQRKLCTDQRALVKAGMCKRAPQDAHFKLDSVVPASPPVRVAPGIIIITTVKTTTTTTTTTAGSSSCTDNVDQRKLADEYCSSSWASLCTFFFAMVQSGDC